MEKDAILVCYDNVVKIITPHGKLRENKKQLSELEFDFNIDSICKLHVLIIASDYVVVKQLKNYHVNIYGI